MIGQAGKTSRSSARNANLLIGIPRKGRGKSKVDYQKIYQDFIESRRANPPGEAEYSEKHHVIPRCLGGGDDPDNLIQLIPEDHFFAHVVLAKAHDLPGLWSAAIVMNGRNSRPTIFRRGSRLTYGWVRRRFSKVCQETRFGKDNPNYSDELVTLKHFDGWVLEHTRYEWFSVYDVKHAALCGILNKRRKSYKGWTLPETTKEETGIARKGVNHPNADSIKHRWENIDGRKEYCTRLELRDKYNLASGDISGVICGRHSHCHGWFIEGSNNKINKIGKDTRIYALINKDGKTVKGIRKELEIQCNLIQQNVSALINKAVKMRKGWMVLEKING